MTKHETPRSNPNNHLQLVGLITQVSAECLDDDLTEYKLRIRVKKPEFQGKTDVIDLVAFSDSDAEWDALNVNDAVTIRGTMAPHPETGEMVIIGQELFIQE